MTKVIEMNVQGPKTVLMDIKENKIGLITFWGLDPTPSPINIWRTEKGFTYQDVDANFVREFSDAEFLRWEFEYPHELVDLLKKLPIGICNLQKHLGFTEEERDSLDTRINGFPIIPTMKSIINGDTNNKGGGKYTPPKKKRKKSKKTH